MSIVALMTVVAPVALAGAAMADAIIDNGVVQIGVKDTGELNAPGGTPSAQQGTTIVGLRFVAGNLESTSPGCVCEGWGAGDAITGISGWRGQDLGSGGVVIPESFASTATTATSVVRIEDGGGNPIMRVTHDYHPSPDTSNLYEVTVTIENLSPNAIDPLYTRVMDWDIEPNAFSEFVTIVNSGAVALLHSHDDGFESPNPFGARSPILFLGPPGGPDTFDSGPADHGALFDFGFPTLAAGDSMSFNTYYGAAASEAAANAAISAVGAEVYSFGQANDGNPAPGTGPSIHPMNAEAGGTAGGDSGPTTGSPATFIFAFSGVGGTPVLPDPCPPPAIDGVWFLEEDDHPVLGAPYKLMCEGDHLPLSGSDTVTLSDTSSGPPCVPWASNKATPAAWTSSANGWFGNMDGEEGTVPDFTKLYPSNIGLFDPLAPPADPLDIADASVYPLDGTTQYRPDGPDREPGVTRVSDPPAPDGTTFTVVKDGYLVYIHCNVDPATDLVLHTDGESYIAAPTGAPPFPVPELATLLLTAIGIVGAVAFVRRRRS